MSYDGSSAKSYIRHATEKERLDNLAFASFPEDYLPYAAAPGQSRAPPPYLLWGDERRRRPPKKRRKAKCAGALLCAIGLVVLAILAVVAISVYLGVVTNLFRSPVVSVSGRFTATEDFSHELLNSSSSKFLEKADLYKSKVEKAFYSSSLEPAFIAARIYSFRPGLVVFFRVYLDRRKLQDEAESPPTELVRNLVAQKLAADPESVHVEENEELLTVEPGPLEVIHPLLSTTVTTKQPASKEKKEHQRPAHSEGVGEWRPVPIEDSVSPSFAERPPDGVGLVRLPEEASRRRPSESLGSVRVLDEPPPRIQPPPVRVQPPVGTVRLPSSPVRNPQAPGNPREGTGSVRLLEEISPRNPLLPAPPQEGSDNGFEGVGTVRVLEKNPPKAPRLTDNVGTGSVSLLEDNFEKAPILPVEGVGSVRLIDESPKKVPSDTRATGVASVKELEDTPPQKSSLFENQPHGTGIVRGKEPPTLAPSVSLVVRKPSRSDRPSNLPTRVAKVQQNVDLNTDHSEGVGSIREIITEIDFPPLLQNHPPILASKLLDSGLESAVTSTTTAQDVPEKTLLEDAEIKPQENLTEISLTIHDNGDPTQNETDDLKMLDQSLSESKEDSTSFLLVETTFEEVTTKQLSTLDEKMTTLENILFNHASQQTTISENLPRNVTEDTATEILLKVDDFVSEKQHESFENNNSSTSLDTVSSQKETIAEEMVASTTATSDQDIHSSIINYSQYLFQEPHYHVIEKENKGNVSSQDIFDTHTLEGHGFHKPAKSTPVIPPESNFDTTTESSFISSDSSTEMATPSDVKLPSFNDSIKVSDSSSEFLEYSFNKSVASSNSSSDYDSWSEEEEAVNVTTDDASQQAKIVPQMQSDLLSNDIAEEESDDESGVRFEDEILRHITTVGPQSNGSLTPLEQCPSGSVPCGDEGKCGTRCDLRRDCPSNVDEIGCRCSDLLRAMGQSQKICDGMDDCSDGSDEVGCPWCPSSDHFVCPGSRSCVTLDQVCDGRDDCPGGQDEKRCVSLANSSSEAGTSEYRPEGYLIVRKKGRWGKLCLDTLPASSDTDRRIADLGKAVCSALTYRNMTSSVRSIDKSGLEDSFYQILTEVANNRSSAVTSLFESTSCDEKKVLKVRCATLECGLRPSASSQRRRIVGGRSADGAGAWPWSAALYREGEFQCGAALISDTWLVSAAHCFYSSPHAYWTARLGVLRRGSELRSGGEELRRIEHIVLHPQYEDVGFINDIALLRMERPVPFSDSLRPICLPSSPKEDATLWHGQRCSVVGWGKLYEIGHTFPDSLQEVRLPVISSSECQKRSIFLPAYRITSKMFCAGYDRGGRDACLGDSGGPMACQRPADGRWIILGVTSNGDGCGRPGRPGVYSQVSGFLTWIQETMLKEIAGGKTGSESLCVGGVRCRLGRCVPSSRVCDGRRDCAGGEDEEEC